jgi:hypothetical protein
LIEEGAPLRVVLVVGDAPGNDVDIPEREQRDDCGSIDDLVARAWSRLPNS